jgi:hypothetical protein
MLCILPASPHNGVILDLFRPLGRSEFAMLGWFDVEDVLKFADEIVLAAGPMLALVAKGGKGHAGRKDQKRFDGLLTRVADFARSSPLNVYKKARFLNAVKWKLREAGHDENLVDDFVTLLTGALNRR